MNKLFALSLLAALISVPAVLAEAPKMAFDATYDCTGPAGPSTLRTASDGKGHLRTESTAAGQHVITLVDYPAMQATTLLVNQKMAMKTPIKDTPEVHDAESAKRAKAKDLGMKDVDGHKCHGYEYASEAATHRVWIGEDTHYMVHSETELKTGEKMTTTLKSWSAKAPAAQAFTVPDGYKAMQVPTAASMPMMHK